MSCDLVDKNVIDYLVFNCIKYKIATKMLASEIKELLIFENERSAFQECQEPIQSNRASYKTNTLYADDPLQVLQTISYYVYQTCMSPEWRTSKTFELMELLKEAALSDALYKSKKIWGAPGIQDRNN